jgi:hypothetical protein
MKSIGNMYNYFYPTAGWTWTQSGREYSVTLTKTIGFDFSFSIDLEGRIFEELYHQMQTARTMDTASNFITFHNHIFEKYIGEI